MGTTTSLPMRWRPCGDDSGQDRGPWIVVTLGDLTTATIDAIVSSTDPALFNCSGMAAALAVKGGREIHDDCKWWIQQHKGLPVGHAISTRAGKLPCCYVIHTVGPRVGNTKPTEEQARLLRAGVRSSLCEADRLKLTSIAISGISSRYLGYPKHLTAEEIVRECVRYARKHASETTLETIVLLDTDPTMCWQFAHSLRKAAKVSGRGTMPESVNQLTFTNRCDTYERKARKLRLPMTPSPSPFEFLSPSDNEYKRILAELPSKFASRIVSIRRVRVSPHWDAYEKIKQLKGAQVQEMEPLYHGTPERWRATAISLRGFDLSIQRTIRTLGHGVYTSTSVEVADCYTRERGSLLRLRGLVVSSKSFFRRRNFNTISSCDTLVFPDPTALVPTVIIDYGPQDEKDLDELKRR